MPAVAERKLLADIVESTDAFVQVLDLEYRFIAINRAGAREFESIFGVRPKVGDSLLELLKDHPGKPGDCEIRLGARTGWRGVHRDRAAGRAETRPALLRNEIQLAL